MCSVAEQECWLKLIYQKQEGKMGRFLRVFVLTSSIFIGGAAIAHAAVAVPEIDPSMASAGLALLACGALILGSKFIRK